MTCREKLMKEYPGACSDEFTGGCYGCPHDYGYLSSRPPNCIIKTSTTRPDPNVCKACWDREIPNAPDLTPVH